MLLLWWCPFKIQKEKRAGLQFTSPDYLSSLLTPLRIRWTIPLRQSYTERQHVVAVEWDPKTDSRESLNNGQRQDGASCRLKLLFFLFLSVLSWLFTKRHDTCPSKIILILSAWESVLKISWRAPTGKPKQAIQNWSFKATAYMLLTFT